MELPKNWINTTLDELGEGSNAIVDGPFGSNLKTSDYINDKVNGIPVLTTKNLEGDYSEDSVRYISKEKFEELKRSQVNPGDIIVAKIGSIGKNGIYPINARTGIIPANLLKFTVSKHINRDYVYYFINTHGFQNTLRNISTATAQPAYNVTKFRNLEIPLAPLNEQNRIVEKLDELLSELEKGKEQLQTSLDQLKVYRQSILKHAFEGKLTNNESDLQKVNFHSIIKLISGNTPKGVEKATNKGSIPFYRVSDMNLNGNEVEMRTSNVLLLIEEKEKLKIKTYPKGTVIFPKRGGAILTNKKRVLGEVAAFDLNLMGALPNEKVSSKYLFYWFIFLDLSKICDGSNVPQINYKNFDSIEFDYYIPDIQSKIVDVIELNLSICDEMESSIHNNLVQSDSLRSTILQKAFEGKLVEQDPTDEPASVLLERIKKEREEFLKAEKERKKTEKPLDIKTRKMAEELKRIIEILKDSKEPVSAKTLWQSSTHKDDIDDFYAALKKHIESGEIIELPRKGKESFLKLADSK